MRLQDKEMRKSIVVVCLLLCSFLVGQYAHAGRQIITVTWTKPLKDTNNDDLPKGRISFYSVCYTIDLGNEQCVRVYGENTKMKQIYLFLDPRVAPYLVTMTITATDALKETSAKSEEVTLEVTVAIDDVTYERVQAPQINIMKVTKA